MRTWIRPMVVEDKMVANARVADSVFYNLSCLAGSDNSAPGNHWPQKESSGVYHSSAGTTDTCADPNTNRIITGNGGLLKGSQVGEKNGEQEWLSGTIDYHDDKNHNGIVDPGDIIYWHTTSSDHRRVWNY